MILAGFVTDPEVVHIPMDPTDAEHRPELRGRPAGPGPARLTLFHLEQLTPAQAALQNQLLSGPRSKTAAVPLIDEQGRLLGPFAIMLLAPEIGSAVQAVGAALRFHPGSSARFTELAILTVAASRRCEFEWLAHESAGRAAGLSNECLQDLLDGAAPRDLSVAEAVAVRTIRELVSSGGLDDSSYADAVDLLGVHLLAVLVWLVGYYGMLATALSTFRPAPAQGGGQ